MSAPEMTLEEKLRALYELVGITLQVTPAPPADAPPPPRPWSDTDEDDEEGTT